MAASLGRVVASLAEPVDRIPPELIDLINQRISPPEKIGPDDVYVRAMYVVSDAVNSFGGCFPPDEHQRLTELLIDSPVMIGHRKDKLPVGRTFHAVTVERDGRPWVKSYFYWLRSAVDAEQLRDNIDGGVYKECSVAFTFLYPQCSLCGEDIRRCEHQPLQSYNIDGVERRCHFNYRRLEKVLETSLVYRGAVPDTRITRDLGLAADGLRPLQDLSELDSERRYLLAPRYDGLPVTARSEGASLIVERLDCAVLPVDSQLVTWRPQERVRGVLVGYRGKDRCSRAALEKFLAERTGPVSRLLLNVFPDGKTVLSRGEDRSAFGVRVIPHRVATREQIEARSREIMTRLGVEIRPLEGESLTLSDEVGFHYVPGTREANAATCRLEWGERSILTLPVDGDSRSFEIANLDLTRLTKGRRFVARQIDNAAPDDAQCRRKVLNARLLECISTGDVIQFRAAGEIEGSFRLRPVRLHGERSFLFHRLPDKNNVRPMVIAAGAAYTEREKSKSVLHSVAESDHDGE